MAFAGIMEMGTGELCTGITRKMFNMTYRCILVNFELYTIFENSEKLYREMYTDNYFLQDDNTCLALRKKMAPDSSEVNFPVTLQS